MFTFATSLDELVFEGRNQAYGAYQLRRDYQNHLASAGGITLVMCALVLLSWLAWPAATPKPVVSNPIIARPIEVLTKAEIEKEKPKPAVVAPVRPALPRTATAPPAPVQPTEVAKDELVPPLPPPTIATIMPVDGAAGHAALGEAAALASGGGETGGTGTAGSTGTAPAGPPTPFIVVEKMPEFAGGQAALMRYLREHLRYPSQALRQEAEGRVFMSFVVGADGHISDVEVLKGLGYGLDEEALRVVRQMPAWTPGYQAQHAVPVRFTLPITFAIQ